MDPFEAQMAQMTAIQAMGGAMAGDPAITGSPASVQVFTYCVDDGRLLAFAVDGSTVTPYSPEGSAPTVIDALRDMRTLQSEPWGAAVVRPDKSTSGVELDFLFDDTATVDPRAHTPEEIATFVLSRDG